MKTTILYCGFGWAGNIGNAFIDYGMKYILNQIFEEKLIIFASNTPSWLSYKYRSKPPFNLFSKKCKDPFDLRIIMNSDFYVFGGALLSKNWLKINSFLINYLKEEKKQILIIGGSGGNNYCKEEIEAVKSILKQLNIFLLVSRDNDTYENYKELAQFSYNGIDCAFFLNDIFKPAEINLEDYIISAFDHRKEPDELPKGKNILRLYHSSWDLGRLELMIKKPIKTMTLMHKNDLISDYPDDYLNLYANCQETYSDRVHACVAALIFGNKARYYPDSPRSLLFERVGMISVKEKLSSLDLSYIRSEKEKQLNFLKDILKT